MIVNPLRAAAVAALCLFVVAQPAVGSAADLIMPYKFATDPMDWNTKIMATFSGRNFVEDMVAVGLKSVILAFATGECGSELWNSVPGAEMLKANVGQIKKAGIKVRLSSGGQGSTFTCGSQANFDKWIAGWNDAGVLEGVDFDIENGQSKDDIAALVLRAKEGLVKYPSLVFSFTVPSLGQSPLDQHVATSWPAGQAPDPFSIAGQMVMQEIVAQMAHTKGTPATWPNSKLRINPMTMDYGNPASSYLCVLQSDGGHCSMGESAIQAAYNLHGHWGVPLQSIELTPLIGDNDLPNEDFTVADTTRLAQWASKSGIAKIHYWNYDRDTPCDAKTAPKGHTSNTCNTVGKMEHQFVNTFLGKQTVAARSHVGEIQTSTVTQKPDVNHHTDL